MKRQGAIFSLLILAFITVGCGTHPSDSQRHSSESIEIDPRFREFYGWLGGINNLGPAISPKFSHDGYEYQYTAAALLVFSPQAQGDQQYSLASLGLEMDLCEIDQVGEQVNYGALYPGFQAKYIEMGGFQYVGSALTEARYNPEKGRIEQYFANLGFYLLDSNPEEVQLLQYGAWKCAEQCEYAPTLDAEVVLWSSLGVGFEDAIRQLNPSFTGRPLSDPHFASDGLIEQIFENVIIVADPSDPTDIRLRSIVKLIGLPGDDSVTYDVPGAIQAFLEKNPGVKVSGIPVTSFEALSTEIYRQCFTDLCIDYFPNKVDSLRVRLVPLGYTYQNLQLPDDNAQNGSGNSTQPKIITWKKYPILQRDKNQVISVKILSGDEPLASSEPVIILSLPESDELLYTFPLTDQDGNTSIELETLNAPPGSWIEYRVCLLKFGRESTCINDEFLMWSE